MEGWGGGGGVVVESVMKGRGGMGCRGGRQQMACHTARAVGWHPEEEEEGAKGLEGHRSQSASRHQGKESREAEVRGFGGRRGC